MAHALASGQLDVLPDGSALHWSVAVAAKYPDGASGDGYSIKRSGSDLMFALVDGSGSGVEAVTAKDLCLRAFETATTTDLDRLFNDCHAALRGSRGAAMAVACVNAAKATLHWAAIGDIDGLLYRGLDNQRSTESLMQIGGTVGISMRKVRPQSTSLGQGDLLLLASDGVSRRYRNAAELMDDADTDASKVLSRFGRSNDDKSVLMIRCKEVIA